MEIWEKYLGDFYEKLDTLKESDERQVLLLYDRQGKRLCVLKEQEISAFSVYNFLKNCENKHIPQVYYVFKENQKCFVLEEHIAGKTLSDILDNGNQLPEEKIENILRQLLECLYPLHKENIIHRDIKPSNLILTNDNILKLIDFGIARTVKQESATDTICFGTRGFSPPEQYGFGQTDARSDIYSVGMTIKMFRPQSEKLRRIVNKATEFSPENRYSTVAEILRELHSEQIIGDTMTNKALSWFNRLSLHFNRVKIDAKAVEEELSEKLLSFEPILPATREVFDFIPKSVTLEPNIVCPENNKYAFASEEEAMKAGLSAFEQYVYNNRDEYIQRLFVYLKETQLKNYCVYEISKNNYYHKTNRIVENRINEIINWGVKNGLKIENVPRKITEFSCVPIFEANEGSHLWNLEHFEDMPYLKPIYEILDKWSGAIPPIMGYKRHIKVTNRLVNIAENKDGEIANSGDDFEFNHIDFYAFKTDKAIKEFWTNILYATDELIKESEELRADIHGTIREAYGKRLKFALKAKAEELRKYFRIVLGE